MSKLPVDELLALPKDELMKHLTHHSENLSSRIDNHIQSLFTTYEKEDRTNTIAIIINVIIAFLLLVVEFNTVSEYILLGCWFVTFSAVLWTFWRSHKILGQIDGSLELLKILTKQ